MLASIGSCLLCADHNNTNSDYWIAVIVLVAVTAGFLQRQVGASASRRYHWVGGGEPSARWRVDIDLEQAPRRAVMN